MIRAISPAPLREINRSLTIKYRCNRPAQRARKRKWVAKGSAPARRRLFCLPLKPKAKTPQRHNSQGCRHSDSGLRKRQPV